MKHALLEEENRMEVVFLIVMKEPNQLTVSYLGIVPFFIFFSIFFNYFIIYFYLSILSIYGIFLSILNYRGRFLGRSQAKPETCK